MLRFRNFFGSKRLIFDKKTVDYKWVILSKLDCFEQFELNTLFYRVFNGLLEYQKIIENEHIKLKL